MKSVLFSLLSIFFTTSTYALRLTLPSSDGNQDIALTGPTQVDSNANLVIRYIQLANEYLRIAMVVVAFAVIVWMGFKLFTNQAGSDDAKKVLKDGFIALGAGFIIIFSAYTVVRLIINLI